MGAVDDLKKYGSYITPYQMRDLRNTASAVDREWGKGMETRKGLMRGLNDVPVVGPLLEGITAPVAQTFSLGADVGRGLTGGGWDAFSKRDPVSDLAAAGDAALTVFAAPIAGKLNKVPAAAKLLHPKTFLGSVGAGALTGTGWGALNSLREHGRETTFPQAASEALLTGAFTGALGGLGYGIGKGAKKLHELANRGPLSKSTEMMVYQGAPNYQQPDLRQYYEILGVEPTADTAAINSAYRKKAAAYHPDRWMNADDAVRAQKEALFKEVNKANTALKEALNRPTASYIPPEHAYSTAEKLRNLKLNLEPIMQRYGNSSPVRGLKRVLQSPVAKVGLGVAGGLALNNLLKRRPTAPVQPEPIEEMGEPTLEELDYANLLNQLYGGYNGDYQFIDTAR